MELSMVPDRTDAEMLQEEIEYIHEGKEEVFEIMERSHGMRSVGQNMAQMMSGKMFLYAVLGTLVIVLFNGLIFREVQVTMKNRKMI